MCVGACYKVEEEMNFFFLVDFGGWGLRLWLVVVAMAVAVGSGCGCGCKRWWRWVLAMVVGLLGVKETKMRIKNNKKLIF